MAVFCTQLNHTLETVIYFNAFFPLNLSFALYLVLTFAVTTRVLLSIETSQWVFYRVAFCCFLIALKSI